MKHPNATITRLAAALSLTACAAPEPPTPAAAQRLAGLAAPPPVAAGSCAALAQSRLPDTVLQVVQDVPAGTAQAGQVALPAHCLVRGEIGARTGVGGARYATGFELRLPLAWNGRFQFMGGGGTDGMLRPAFGFTHNGSAPALAQGYAVASSDFGHQKTDPRDASFGLDPQARIDWGHASLALVTNSAETRAKPLSG